MLILIVMKQYVIDELRSTDYKKLKAYFQDHFSTGSLDGIYWLPVESDLLTKAQTEHSACQPLCVAIDLEDNRVVFELLLRSQDRIRCSCMGYATEAQRNWVIQYADAILDQLEIKA